MKLLYGEEDLLHGPVYVIPRCTATMLVWNIGNSRCRTDPATPFLHYYTDPQWSTDETKSLVYHEPGDQFSFIFQDEMEAVAPLDVSYVG